MRRASIMKLAGGTVAGTLAGYAGVQIYRWGRSRAIPSGTQIVILGGGFGGLAAAERLALLTEERACITLIDRNNYHLFTPMLYQVASAAVGPYDVAVQLRPLLSPRGTGFRKTTATGIDFEQQRVETDTGAIGYDYLIIALGSTTNFFGNTSAEQYAVPLKLLESGVYIRNQVIDLLEKASFTHPNEREALLTFVVVGGGATGVETAGALSDIVRHVIDRDYPMLHRSECRVVVLEMAPKLLGYMSAGMADVALRQLKATGVEVRLNSKVKSVKPDYIETEDGLTLPTRTVIWTAGVRAPALIADLPVAHGHSGTIQVDECLRVPSHPNVLAIGDCAQVMSGNKPVPMLAAAAAQEGRAAADNVFRMMRREIPVRFHYRNLGNSLSIGHSQGVTETGGYVIGGFPGWLAWRIIHLARIATFRNKAETVLDWTGAFFSSVDIARLEIKARRKAA